MHALTTWTAIRHAQSTHGKRVMSYFARDIRVLGSARPTTCSPATIGAITLNSLHVRDTTNLGCDARGSTRWHQQVAEPVD